MKKRFFFAACFVGESLQLIYHVKIDVIFVIVDVKVDVSLWNEIQSGQDSSNNWNKPARTRQDEFVLAAIQALILIDMVLKG